MSTEEIKDMEATEAEKNEQQELNEEQLEDAAGGILFNERPKGVWATSDAALRCVDPRK